MKQYLKVDPWHIIEDTFHPQYSRVSESIFSLGNGHMGHRGTFEETYTGDTLQGSYMAGIYYPDKTIVGWWKVGYPEYFAKIPNSTCWTGVRVYIDGEELDLAKVKILSFTRDLDMRCGVLSRDVAAQMPSGVVVSIRTQRFVSMARREVGVLKYAVELSRQAEVEILTGLDGLVRNEEANYGEYFWDWSEGEEIDEALLLHSVTRKTGFHLTSACRSSCSADGVTLHGEITTGEGTAEITYRASAAASVELNKTISCLTSRDHAPEKLAGCACNVLEEAWAAGFEKLIDEHRNTWEIKWNHSDITIEGEPSSQQGVRFALFQLHQTYAGNDDRLNIGPKGFTGEKYGGSTYWDTEAFCFPFYLSTAERPIARNLLLYRYRHLQKAIENASKMGIGGGAALFPMVTINGEECHNEWEITFEEIHRNSAIVYAIWNYINCTGDWDYVRDYGLEVMCAVCRFWMGRVSYSRDKKAYVILGVTGPNEYENNINNNWYTNRMASWCLQWILTAAGEVKRRFPVEYDALCAKIGLNENELEGFLNMSRSIYLPEEQNLGIFLQQDGYLDKEDLIVSNLSSNDLPLNQKWTWDRILRSCFIKQADVLQGLFMLQDSYDLDTLERNFDFYEPRTVHESSLSPCIHCILAERLGRHEKAYEMYLRTARLDLDDYNNDTRDGCHITSMSGTWMAVVMGFGGLSYRDTLLELYPSIPDQWESYAFKLMHQGNVLKTQVSRTGVLLENEGPEELRFSLYGITLVLKAQEKTAVSLKLP